MKFTGKTAAAILAVTAIGITAATAMSGSLYSKNKISVPDGFDSLVFADEFDADGAPDSTKWTFEQGYLRNGERQYYTTGGNVSCRGGNLVIELRRDSAMIDSELCPITSGSIMTSGLHSWKYGYIEVRAKVPASLGVWPAIRLLPAEQVYGSWPRSGEIDIMELVGHQPETVHFTAHTERFNHIRSSQRRHSSPVGDASGSFHTYGLKWTENILVWYLDGEEQYFIERGPNDDWTAWPFDSEFYLSLNLAYGGSWGGAEGTDDGALPQRFEIDYVRVYQ